MVYLLQPYYTSQTSVCLQKFVWWFTWLIDNLPSLYPILRELKNVIVFPHSKFSWQQKPHEIRWPGRWPTQNHPVSFHGGGAGSTWVSLIPVWHLLTTKTSHWFCHYHDSLSECSKPKFYVVKWVSLNANKNMQQPLGKYHLPWLSVSWASLTSPLQIPGMSLHH